MTALCRSNVTKWFSSAVCVYSPSIKVYLKRFFSFNYTTWKLLQYLCVVQIATNFAGYKYTLTGLVT